MTPPINEVINLLSRFAPTDLQMLRAKYPAARTLLAAGEEMGNADTLHDIKAPDRPLTLQAPGTSTAVGAAIGAGAFLAIRAEASVRGLNAVIALCDPAMPIAKRRLVAASYFRLGGQVLSLLGSGAVLGSLKADVSVGVFPVVSAIVAFLGGVISIVAEFLVSGLFQGGQGLGDIYRRLLQLRAEAIGSSELLTVWLRAAIGAEGAPEVEGVITRANQICAEVPPLVGAIPGGA